MAAPSAACVFLGFSQSVYRRFSADMETVHMAIGSGVEMMLYVFLEKLKKMALSC